MAEIQTGYFNFSSGHQGITSSRGFIKGQGKVSISKTNDVNKQLLVILIHSIPPRAYWKFTLKGYSRGSSKQFVKGQCSINLPWQAHSFQYSLDSPRPLFQSYIMGKSFNTVYFPIWKGVHCIRQSIQDHCQPEGVKI
ncbi:hypothetical protein O181_102055 [Austropuccinia psidii MF-1]|uniref:Uncharacterized protein n=1 Tax=Austropuccinia psidii MF-1 TaxID=1389203 RepID=A0A9Q3PIE1_9BASI|nr:hypothetical protein [Austropuccinia psidii MF-1]